MGGSIPRECPSVHEPWTVHLAQQLLKPFPVTRHLFFTSDVCVVEDAVQSLGKSPNDIPWKSTGKCIQVLLHPISLDLAGPDVNPLHVNRPGKRRPGSEPTCVGHRHIIKRNLTLTSSTKRSSPFLLPCLSLNWCGRQVYPQIRYSCVPRHTKQSVPLP